MYGIGLSWGAQYSKVTPILQVLGISDSMLGIAWLAGPIAGIVVQPIVGDLSDRLASRIGRRRLWMWIGAIGQTLSMVLMAYAPELGRLAGDVKGSQPCALAIAVASFWLADVFLNAQQAPARTLIVDVAPPQQLAAGNGYFSLWDSIGKITGFFLGSIDAAASLPSLTDEYAGELFAGVRLVFGFSIGALFATMAAVQCAAREKPPSPAAAGSARRRCADVITPIYGAFRSIPTLPRDVRTMFAVLFFLFFTWFVTWMYLPALMGTSVYHGAPDPALADNSTLKQAYNDGVLASSSGMLGASCVTLALAFVVPRLTIAFGEMRVFTALEVLHVALLALIANVTDKNLAFLYICMLGAPFSAFLVVPYALVGRAAKATEGGAGKVMATMNLFMCLPELVVSLVLGPVVAAANGSMRVPMIAAALTCAIAVAILACGFPDGWRGAGCAALSPSWRQGMIRAEAASSTATAGDSRGCDEDDPVALAVVELRLLLQASQAQLEEQRRTIAAHEVRIAKLELESIEHNT